PRGESTECATWAKSRTKRLSSADGTTAGGSGLAQKSGYETASSRQLGGSCTPRGTATCAPSPASRARPGRDDGGRRVLHAARRPQHARERAVGARVTRSGG